MSALFGDFTLLHHHDTIDFFDGGKPVRDDDGGAFAHQRFQRRLNVALGLCI